MLADMMFIQRHSIHQLGYTSCAIHLEKYLQQKVAEIGYSATLNSNLSSEARDVPRWNAYAEAKRTTKSISGLYQHILLLMNTRARLTRYEFSGE